MLSKKPLLKFIIFCGALFIFNTVGLDLCFGKSDAGKSSNEGSPVQLTVEEKMLIFLGKRLAADEKKYKDWNKMVEKAKNAS